MTISRFVFSENILVIINEEGYNLLQKCVGINNVDMIRLTVGKNQKKNCLIGFFERIDISRALHEIVPERMTSGDTLIQIVWTY